MNRSIVVIAAILFMTRAVAAAGESCAVVIATSDGRVALRSGPTFTSLELRQLPSGQFVKVSELEVDGGRRWRIVTELMEPRPGGNLRHKTTVWGYVVARYLHPVACEPNRPAPVPPVALPYQRPRPEPPAYQPPPRYDDSISPRSAIEPPSAMPAARTAVFQHGIVRYRSSFMVEAPFKIITSEGANYFFKLVESHTGEEELAGFILGGRPLDTKVPYGTYVLRYAFGDVWISEEEFFGPSTGFAKAESLLTFTTDGSRALGIEVQLILQRGGNLRTSPIKRSEF